MANVQRPGVRPGQRDSAPIMTGAFLVGLAFVVIGVAGFLPGITTDYSGMAFSGDQSEAKLLGLFEVSVLHNILHLVLGMIGIFLSWALPTARLYLLIGGAAYLLLGVYGFLGDPVAGDFLPTNTADDWLHVALGVIMVVFGLVLSRELKSHRRLLGPA